METKERTQAVNEGAGAQPGTQAEVKAEPIAGSGEQEHSPEYSRERINELHQAFWAAHRLGLGVIPTAPGRKKPPLVEWKRYKRERADAHTIRWWLARWPNANPVIVTGRISGVIVHDVDGPEGKATLASIGGAPRTWTVKTHYGHQYYYRYPAHIIPATYRIKNFVGKLPGFDLRADGGLAIAPGATHPDGGVYAWAPGLSPDEVELADPPDWLMALVKVEEMKKPTQANEDVGKSGGGNSAGTGRTGSGGKSATVGSRINRAYAEAALRGEIEKVSTSVQGTRNDQLNKSAYALGQLVAAGMLDRGEVERELEIAARACGLDGDPGCGISGIRATIRSGLQAGLRRPRKVPVAVENGRFYDSQSHQGNQAEAESEAQEQKRRSSISLPVTPISADLPMIDITNRQLRDITADALRALIDANDPPRVFLRSGDLVRVRTDEHGRWPA